MRTIADAREAAYLDTVRSTVAEALGASSVRVERIDAVTVRATVAIPRTVDFAHDTIEIVVHRG